MKAQLFFRITASLLLLLAARSSSLAQQGGRIDTLPPVIITGTSVVSQKVTDSFKKDFKDALHPRWYQMDKNYLVKFIMNEQKNNSLYDRNGYLIYHISYGKEKHLPADVISQVKTGYPTYDITTAIHVNQANRSIWVINLESGKNWVLARVEDGQLDEVERLRKAN